MLTLQTWRPENAERLVADYRRRQAVMVRVQNGLLLKSLPKPAIIESARRLGMEERGVIVFNNEEESAVLADFTLHQFRWDGKTVSEHLLGKEPFPGSRDEHEALVDKCNVWYSIVQVCDVIPECGILVRDVLFGGERFLTDVNFSRCVSEGYYIASHLQPLQDFCHTTGAALPFSAAHAPGIFRRIERVFRGKLGQRDRTDPTAQGKLSALVIREALQLGLSDSVAYR